MSPDESTLEKAVSYAVSVLQDLIRIPTVSPQGEGYEEAASLLARELESAGFKVEVVKVPGDYAEKECPTASRSPRFIVYGWRGQGKALHFNGHYDVVPGGPGWSVTDPFKPRMVNGRIYGRGAVDMKGGIAAVLGAFKALADAGAWPDSLRLEAAFVPDEEIGGECGTGYLVKSMGIRPEFVVIPEPSGLDRVWYGHKGLLWAKVRVRGRTAHGSMPWLGENAFLAASRLALALSQALSAAYSSRRSRHPIEPPEAAYPTFTIGGRAGVPGGGKTNQVPGEFEFTIDRRLIPEETVEGALAEIEALVRFISQGVGVDASVEKVTGMEPAASKLDTLYKTLSRVVVEIVGVEPRPVICPGGLDLRYYTAVGSEALSYGPRGDLAHAPDEYIEVEELEKLIAVFARLPARLEEAVKGG